MKPLAHASHFVPVLQREVLIAFGFVLFVWLSALLAYLFQATMEFDDEGQIRIVRRQVDASAEPPLIAGLKVADVHVWYASRKKRVAACTAQTQDTNSRDVRIKGVNNETDASGSVWRTGRNRELCDRSRREIHTRNPGEIHAACAAIASYLQ